MSQEQLSQAEHIALQKLLKRIGCEDVKLPEPHTPQAEKFCGKCGYKTHSSMACKEVKDFYKHPDEEYFRLIDLILSEGRTKHNRTGIDTIGVFGAQAKFDVDMNAFPILTTKKVWFKGIVHELLWFIRGDTNIKYLVDNDVHIWDEWAYKRYTNTCISEISENHLEHLSVPSGFSLSNVTHLSMASFIDKIKEDSKFAAKWGELGEGTYGGMWRAFPYAYEAPEYEYGAQKGTEIKVGHVDQLKKVIDKLKTNPDDRRMIVSAWHPYWVDHCALPPCHCLFHFNTEELTMEERMEIIRKENPAHGSTALSLLTKFDKGDKELKGFDVVIDQLVPKRRLNCLLYQRSNDTALGIPYNITSYCLLTAMIAQCVGMEPGVFTHTYGDLHIYTNHLDGIKEQRTRLHKPLPKLWLNPEVKSVFDFKYDDIKLIGYESHPTIKFEVAV